jgi:hypothetical protein
MDSAEGIKIDLLNKFLIEKYYIEREIIRLSELENIKYSEKIEKITEQIDLLIQNKQRIDAVNELFTITDGNQENKYQENNGEGD